MAQTERPAPSTYEFEQDGPPGPRFERAWPVRTSDVTPERQVRLDAIARYLQDMANDEMFHRGFDATDPYWLVRRTIIDVHEPLFWPSDVQLNRWCEATSSRWCNMRITLRGSAGGHVETEGFWIRFSAETAMPTRISDCGMEYLTQYVSDTKLRWRALNNEPMPEAGDVDREYQLRSTDFDPFQHLNNTVYLQLVEDDLAGSALLRNPHRAVIEYLAPLPIGARVQLRSRTDEAGYRMWLVRLDDDGVPAAKPAATVSVVPLAGEPFGEAPSWPPPQVDRIDWAG